jgi:hypothetical protein
MGREPVSGVRFGTGEAFPVPSAVYRCACGRHAVQHGRDAACVPAGWQEVGRKDASVTLVCPECAARRAEDEPGAEPPAR